MSQPSPHVPTLKFIFTTYATGGKNAMTKVMSLVTSKNDTASLLAVIIVRINNLIRGLFVMFSFCESAPFIIIHFPRCNSSSL